jgi:hypothetical protein
MPRTAGSAAPHCTHMAWANTIVGVSELRTHPVLDTTKIVRFLQRYAR